MTTGRINQVTIGLKLGRPNAEQKPGERSRVKTILSHNISLALKTRRRQQTTFDRPSQLSNSPINENNSARGERRPSRSKNENNIGSALRTLLLTPFGAKPALSPSSTRRSSRKQVNSTAQPRLSPLQTAHPFYYRPPHVGPARCRERANDRTARCKSALTALRSATMLPMFHPALCKKLQMPTTHLHPWKVCAFWHPTFHMPSNVKSAMCVGGWLWPIQGWPAHPTCQFYQDGRKTTKSRKSRKTTKSRHCIKTTESPGRSDRPCH